MKWIITSSDLYPHRVTPTKKAIMQNGDDEEIIDKICDYAQQYQIKELLQEYLKRVIVNKPADPVAFLMQSIQENPVVLGAAAEPNTD
jgi:acyl-coenzyme A synthetase/AMP-(fatty) acid ligase